MDNKSFDYKLKEICTENINIPQKFTNAIKNGLYEKNKKWRFLEMKKVAISTMCIVFVSTGIVFASALLKNFWSNNSGIKTALDYGYVQNIDMDYNEQNDLGVKLESLIIDNSNVGIVFNYKMPSNWKNIDNIVLNDIIIKDENNNIICEDGNTMSLCTGYTSDLASENGIIKQAMLLTNSEHTFPRSKNIYISFSEVNIFGKGKKIRTVTGNWNFNIDVTDKFINRESVIYAASTDKEIEIVKAELTSTSFDIEMKFNNPKNAEYLINNIKLQDDLGQEFKVNEISATDELTIPTIKTSFPISIFDAQDNYKLVIKTDREIVIELNKVE